MRQPLTILFDGSCGLCQRARSTAEWFDWLKQLDWRPYQAPQAALYGIPRDALEERMYAVQGTRRWSGYAAWRQIILRLPLSYLLLLGIAILSPLLALLVVLLFSWIFDRAGEWLYDLVAKNRHRLPGSTCHWEP
jgi:predicted DCC family thiol-disulfide oxidoreductase YuxK